MPNDLVLLTGATGLVGFRTLRTALENGYRVRAVVRSTAKADAVRTNKASNVEPGQLDFVIVPDFLEAGAFDEAVRDVRYIVHVASPVPKEGLTGADDLDAEMIQPAVRGTLSILEAARKAGSVKRVVVTSSMVATLPLAVLLGNPSTEVFGPDYRAEGIPAPYMRSPDVAYVASKIAALKSASELVAENKPAFDVIHIHPSFVIGRDDMTATSKGCISSTNALALDLVLGKKEELPRLFATVHVDDVALAHVRALGESVAGNQSFLVSDSEEEHVQVGSRIRFCVNSADHQPQWNDAITYVNQKFPTAVAKGILPNDGSVPSAAVRMDTSKTKEVLGIHPKTFEEQVLSVVGHYLEVLESESKELHE